MQIPNNNQYATLNHYHLLNTIGRGGFAKAKRAICTNSNMTFAIKIFKKSQLSFNKKAFLKEVDCLSLIQHKNVPAFIESYESVQYIKRNGQSYEVAAIVMEYIPNGDLFNYIVAGEGLSEAIARTYFRTLIETLGDVHNQGIAHRDIKAENLLLDGSFNVKLGDFGLSTKFRDENGIIPLTEQYGTEGFQAPEILQKKPYDGSKVDIFSCGIVLFTLVACCKPLMQANPRFDRAYSYLAEKNYDAFWRYCEKRMKKEFSNEFKDLLNSMLALAPEERPTIQQIKDHSWYNGPVLDSEDLKKTLSPLKEKVDVRIEEERRREKEEAAARAQQKRPIFLGFTGIQPKK